MGLIAKNSKHTPRFAIRFNTVDDIESFTKEKELPTYINTSRWRLEGVSPTIGAAGIIQFLETKGWSIHELLYCGERHAVYTATKMGSVGPMFYRHPGSTPQQLRFKALNSLAKKEQAAASQADRSKSTASNAAGPSSSQKRTTFLRITNLDSPDIYSGIAKEGSHQSSTSRKHRTNSSTQATAA